MFKINIEHCSNHHEIPVIENKVPQAVEEKNCTKDFKRPESRKKTKNLLDLVKRNSAESKPQQNAVSRPANRKTQKFTTSLTNESINARRKTVLLTIPSRRSRQSISKSDMEIESSINESSEISSNYESGSFLASSGSSIALYSINPSEQTFVQLSDSFRPASSHVRKTFTLEKEKLNQKEIRINQYVVSSFLGCGAFGKVYKAADCEGNLYAVKIYNKRVMKSRWISKGKTALSLIQSEIEILEVAIHPNIIMLHEVINKESYHKLYMVLEYAEKGTLKDKGRVNESQAKKYFSQLIDGLEYLHETLRIVHRDIKPDNILFDGNDVLKISDFGSAQYLQNGNNDLTSSAGTYAFMSPELHGNSKTFRGKPTDIWAAGITLYCMIEGKIPFKSLKLLELANEVKTEQIKIPNYFSEPLKDLFSKIFEKDPDKRITAPGIKVHEWLKSNI